MTTKITDANIDSDKQDNNAFNISLLGFKMAVNDGLTVFNLVDGVVDEFNDESGTDESEGSNDLYNATDDYYINSNTPTGGVIPGISAGFSMTAVTEPDTSTAGTNPTFGSGTFGEFTVPCSVSSLNMYVWGAGGGGGDHGGDGTSCEAVGGGGGGFVSGTLAVTGGQKFEISAGEGGYGDKNPAPVYGSRAFFGGGKSEYPGQANSGGGGGVAGIFNEGIGLNNDENNPVAKAPQIYLIAGAGGGAGGHHPSGTAPAFFGGGTAYWNGSTGYAGSGGGLTGNAGGTDRAQTNSVIYGGTGGPTASPFSPISVGHWNGGGGDQEQGGQAATGSPCTGGGEPGGFLYGGPFTGPDANIGAGGAGYYGGGGGTYSAVPSGARFGGGGSSYYGHPQITCGATESGSDFGEGGGTADPNYVSGTNEGLGVDATVPVGGFAEDGYVLITSSPTCSTTTSTTIVSTAFTATSIPTTARIVVFEENVDTPTLNTDIIASISRDGGTTYTNATLSDSGYVTGSSGQRILTGQATISGQPSGQSMRWKLALANNTVRIHGVSLQWS